MKKFISVFLASAFMISTFAACGGGNDTQTSQEPATSAAESSAPADSAKAEPSGEEITLSIVNKDMLPDDPVIVGFFDRVSEAMKPLGYNIKFKIESVQSGTYSEKLGLLLQSGTIPDIIYFQGGDYQFAKTQNILEDLTPYVEASTHVKASMSKFNVERMKNYPYLLWLNPTRTAVPVVREDLFNKTESGKALLADPTTDNYYNFLKELMEKAGVKYGTTTAGTIEDLDAIFDQAFGNSKTWHKNDDGTYTYFRLTEAEKNKLDYYAKLYKDGLLDNEFLTKKWDTKEKSFYDGESGVIAGTQGKVIDIYNTKAVGQNGEAAKLIVLPPAKGVAQGYKPIDISKEDRGFAISAVSEHKDAAFAVFEFMASPEGQILDKLGEQGVHYDVADNKIKLLPAFAEWYERFWGTTINFNPETPFDETTPFLSQSAQDSLKMVEQFGTEDNAFVLPAELSGKMDAAKAIYDEYATDVITGKKTTADFDDFVKRYLENGGKDIADYANQNLK